MGDLPEKKLIEIIVDPSEVKKNHDNSILAKLTDYYYLILAIMSFSVLIFLAIIAFQSQGNLCYDKIKLDCEPDSQQCLDGSFCIPKIRWCDNTVDCRDASDETGCSCRERISKKKLCDGHYDCPRGEDEVDCFGCSNNSFSCFNDWRKDKSNVKCVPLSERCDGVKQCDNGRDEMNCNILTGPYREVNDLITIRYATGFLWKNWYGKWYRVRNADMSWINEACIAGTETFSMETPKFSHRIIVNDSYSEPVIVLSQSGIVELSPQGSTERSVVYVDCPQKSYIFSPLESTTNASNTNESSTEKLENGYKIDNHESLIENNTSLDSEIRDDYHVKQSKSWPFLVAIYRDGYYHCSGVIVTDYWILTAAHCLEGYRKHYYQVHAGPIRRFSSPITQIRPGQLIVPYPDYKRSTMENDLGFISVRAPFLFNRLVHPIYLPAIQWKNRSIPQEKCITLEWEITADCQPDTDHLKVVKVSIPPKSRHVEDQNVTMFEALKTPDEKVACQLNNGGGPLMCETGQSESQWYLAGIFSHGMGYLNESGIYTNVNQLSSWIDRIINHDNILFQSISSPTCPGFACNDGKCLPSHKRCDKIVDCMKAEDEINCQEMVMDSQRNPSLKPICSEELLTSTIHETSSEVTIEHGEINNLIDGSSLTINSSYFNCITSNDSILMSARCNRVFECKDGSDELNCSCKDILANLQPSAVCNGHVDCSRMGDTDEMNCSTCEKDEYFCHRSGVCIPQSRKCDQINDCPLKEDELDCYALSDGKFILLDIDERPHLMYAGILSAEFDGVWSPICLDWIRRYGYYFYFRKFADDICNYLGFRDAKLQWSSRVSNSSMEPYRLFKGEEEYVDENSPAAKGVNGENTCVGHYIQCRSILSSSIESHRFINTQSESETYLWPWEVAIIVDGNYHCPAILLNVGWLLTTSRCTDNIDLRINFTTAVVGLSPTYKYVSGPHEENVFVNEIKSLRGFNVSVIAQSDRYVRFNHYTQPIFAERRFYPATEEDECIAFGTNAEFYSRTIFLKSEPDNCPTGYRCYRNEAIEECKNQEIAGNWSGIVTCRGPNGWYPAAVFHERDIICGFQSTQVLTSIETIYPYILEIMDGPKNYIDELDTPKCEGVLFGRGKCIRWENICDGIVDDLDGEDESERFCPKKKNHFRVRDYPKDGPDSN